MFSFDSIVTDLIFSASNPPSEDALIEALGGEESLASLKILDPDLQDPRFEMEISPSRPFRRRDERRLMIVDDSNGPLRDDPQSQPILEFDFRDHKENLVRICTALGDHIRLGRLFALGNWGEAAIVARTAVDMRAWALQAWVIDPSLDARARRVAAPLTEAQLDEKLNAYDKRLAELDDEQILAEIKNATIERRDPWIVVSVLDEEGRWDLRESMALEASLAAVGKFSLIPGAKQKGERGEESKKPDRVAAPAKPPEVIDTGSIPTLRNLTDSGRPIFEIPAERFDLDVAARLGQGDWESVLQESDASGPVRDRVFRQGAGFVVPIEFLSEVFIDGKPLTKIQFDSDASALSDDARSLEVHFPRCGAALLIVLGSGARFVTSEIDAGDEVASLLSAGNPTR